MNHKLTFGKCLKLLLTTLNISMSQLAKSINVDNSLVSRWVNEKRIPTSGNFYVERIAEYLSDNLFDPIHINLIDNLCNDFYNKDSVVEISNKDKIRKILYACLIYSKESKEQKNTNSVEFMNSYHNDTKVNTNKKNTHGNIITNSVDLSSDDKIIYGISNIFSAGISLIQSAIENKHKENKIIYISYYNDFYHSFFSKNRLNYLRNILLETINNGWQIVFLLHLDNNVGKAVKFIHFVLPLITTGSINIYYITKHESSFMSKELYVVSGIGALSCYSTDPHSGINCGFYINSIEAINIFHNYINQLLKNNANNLLKNYHRDGKIDDSIELTDLHIKQGELLSYNCNFTNIFIPEKLYQKLLNQTELTAKEKTISMNYYKRQLLHFHKNIRNFKYKDICFADMIEKHIEEGVLYFFTYNEVKKIHVETQDMIDYLDNIIHYIKDYDNYDIAVIFENKDDFIKDISYIIKERKYVFLYTLDLKESDTNIKLSVTEPMFIKSFMEYYYSLWEKISPVNKDKDDIIRWIQNNIDSLRNN